MKILNIFTLLSLYGIQSLLAANCSSKILLQGYQCCSDDCEVIYVDDDGNWGVENGQWCGCGDEQQSCSTAITNQGYQCCSSQCSVIYTDNDGDWGVENGQWCGCGNGTSNQNNNNQENINGKEYMQKLKITNTCPREARYKQQGMKYPTAKKVTYYSNFSKKDHQMNVILPVDYSEDKKYPVLYLLHGFMGNEDTLLNGVGADSIPTYLFKQGKAKEMIVVLPNTYTPEPGKELPPSTDQRYIAGYDNFIYELVDSIMPYMEENYSIATGRENTAVCGFSMGGRNSLYIAYKRSDLFGYVGGFSPAPGVTPGDDWNGHHVGLFSTEDQFRAEIPLIVTLISCGTNDSTVGQFPKGYHDILANNNQDSIYMEVPGAEHDDNAVAAGFYNFVQAAFGALN